MKKVLLILMTVACTLFVTGCEKMNVKLPDTAQRGDYIKARLNCIVTAREIASIAKEMKDTLFKYDVECYNMKYVTLYQDKLIQGDALVVIPKDVPVTRLALYCHGTNVPLAMGGSGKTFSTYSGPKKGQDYDEIRYCALPLASAGGYCTIMPEYPGFASTADLQHPFIYCPELCKSILDAIWAGREFLKKEMNLDPGKDIYISGWSQGGAAALATQKYLERDYPDRANVVVNSCLSGPHNMVHFINSVFNRPNDFFVTIALYSWAGYVMNYFAPTMQRPGDHIFQDAVYDQVTAIMVPGGTPLTVFKDFFVKGVTQGTDKTFMKVLEENSFSSGWTPKGYVHLHHGVDDIIVPCFNSEDAYEGLKHSGKVELHLYENKGHMDFVPLYMTNTLEEFKKARGE